jgi:pSer/pThr/pTyr-binding forkhead associated (FHA) protein
MTELWLKYRDEYGEDRRIKVEGSSFTIGRHSDCSLAVPNGKLSREHVKIDSFGEVFVVSDCGSSNGTTLNGAQLNEPVALQNGDRLNLGGGLDIEIETVSDRPKASRSRADDDNDYSPNYAAGGGQSASGAGASSIPTFVFIAAPALVIVFLVCGGGMLYLFGGNGANNGQPTPEISTFTPTPDDEETPEKSPTPRPSSTAGGGNVSPSPDSTVTQPTPQSSDEMKKIEASSGAFLQRIALNDPTPFLQTTEIEILRAKLSQFKGSSALAENFKAVKASASQFQSLAQSKGLKPQFLAVAALAEIGNSRGNPLETAQRMLPIFGELRVTLSNNLADDNLLMIAAYDQGKAGKFKDLRNTLEALAKKNPSTSPRQIRTIWFLKKQGKITDAEYEFALRFLAIGTITQNPQDFGVNAEAVIFN